MFSRIVLTLALLSSIALCADNPAPASDAELAAITARGRTLAEYDVAAWHATDAVMALNPEQGTTRYYVAKKSGPGWVVVFGKLSENHTNS